MKKLYIAGASEPGYELLDIVRSGAAPYDFLGFYDEVKTGSEIINSVSGLEKGAYFVIAIGNTSVRKRLFELFIASGLIPATIIAPSAFISAAATIGDGVVIYPNCSVSLNAEIGTNVIVNYNCSISHGVKIGDHCNITPGVNIAGNVTIGGKCFLGIGTAIIEKITLCDDVTIGANSTVIRDINIPGTYVGTPSSLINSSALNFNGNKE